MEIRPFRWFGLNYKKYPTDKPLQLTDCSPVRKRSLPDQQRPPLDVLAGLCDDLTPKKEAAA